MNELNLNIEEKPAAAGWREKRWCWPLLVLVLGLAAVGIGQALASRPAFQAPAGDQADLLTRMFGEARTVISLSMIDRAELYFHGGVADLECANPLMDEEKTTALPVNGTNPAGQPSGAAVAENEHEHEHDTAETAPPAWDVWSRLNAEIHPRGHHHLNGIRQEQEVIPWLWAAARLDPHNVLAYAVGGFWLSRRLQKPEEGLRFLEEGLRHNPDASELDFARGEILLHVLHNAEQAYPAFQAARRKWQPDAALSNQENQGQLARILMYLGLLEEQRGDVKQAREHYAAAVAADPENTDAKRHLEQLK